MTPCDEQGCSTLHAAPASRVVSTPAPHPASQRAPHTTSTLILGCGNDLRGDDALGPIVASLLEARLADCPGITVDICCGLTPDLADTLSRIDRLIFVDCAAQGDIGVVQRVELAPRGDADMACVHLLDLPALLTWTHHLFGCSPRAVAFTVAGERFALSESLSPRVQAAVPQLVDAVLAELEVTPEGEGGRHA